MDSGDTETKHVCFAILFLATVTRLPLHREEISELGYRYEQHAGRGTLMVGVVRGRTRILHPLPIMPSELCDDLKRRIGGLTPEVERRFLAQ